MNRLNMNVGSQRNNYFEQDAFQNYSNSYDHLSNPIDFNNFIRSASLGDLKGVCNYINKVYCHVDQESDIDPNHKGWTALMFAAHYGHYDVVKVLLEKRANANHRDANGITPLMCSAQNGHTRCIEMLVGQGKADIKLKDKNNFTAAYYATHYGHGNNKIIAKLLKIPNQCNGYGNFSGSGQSNRQHSNRDHHHYNFAPPSNSQKASPNGLNYANANTSFNEDSFAHYNFNSSINQSFDMRHGLGDAHQGRAQTTGNTSIDINDMLNRSDMLSRSEMLNRSYHQKPRMIFKQKPRRLSPSNQHQYALDLNSTAAMNQSFAGNSGKENKHTRCHSFSNSNQLLLSPVSLPPGTGQRSGSLTLDLHPSCSTKSPPGSAPASNCSPDQGYSSWPNQIFNYDNLPSAFNLTKSPCESQSFGENQTSKQDLSVFDPNESWKEDDSPIEPRNKPRNSTFVSNEHVNYSPGLPKQNFTDLAQDLNEFLRELDLQQLKEKFAQKQIDLHTFLTMSEEDLTAIGITDFEHLATLIAGQLKFTDRIGIDNIEALNYVAYLGRNLEKAKKEIANLQNELKMYRMGLHDIDIKGNNRTRNEPNGYSGCDY